MSLSSIASPPTPYRITECETWRHWVTPRGARDKPVHRWYLFPHSFTGDLVHALVDEWRLDKDDRLLDPFAGAGTTLLAAQERGVPAAGYDLSPLAVMASNVKTAGFSSARLEARWRALESTLAQNRSGPAGRTYPVLVRKALPNGPLKALDAIAARVGEMDGSPEERDFFRLALISILPRFSRAVASGGWLRWSTEDMATGDVKNTFRKRVEMMLSDLRADGAYDRDRWRTCRADARLLPDVNQTYSAVITSPPYPNRHDYTRVFGIELMFAFLDWEQNRALRYQSFHSHPEARPERPRADEYVSPARLERNIDHIKDGRMRRMLRGYFLDMHLSLREVARVCRTGARVAYVLGNARYHGKTILVDEFTAELGERVGLACREIRAVRWRGNSAQQMGKYGRVASRESIVLFEKTGSVTSSTMGGPVTRAANRMAG